MDSRDDKKRERLPGFSKKGWVIYYQATWAALSIRYFWLVSDTFGLLGSLLDTYFRTLKEEVFPGLGITKNRWNLLSYSLKLSFPPKNRDYKSANETLRVTSLGCSKCLILHVRSSLFSRESRTQVEEKLKKVIDWVSLRVQMFQLYNTKTLPRRLNAQALATQRRALVNKSIVLTS